MSAPIARVGAAQGRVLRFLDKACSVTRSGVAQSLTMPDGSALRCAVSVDRNETQMQGLPQFELVRRWLVRFAYGTAVQVGDHAIIADGTYVLSLDVTDPSYGVVRAFFAYQLYDGAGNLALFKTNAIVTVQRRPDRDPVTGVTGAPTAVSGLANIPVFIDDLGNDLKVAGIAAEYGLKMVYESKYAIRDGDMLTGYNPLSLARVPTLTVGHVDPTSPPGIPINTALVKVQG